MFYHVRAMGPSFLLVALIPLVLLIIAFALLFGRGKRIEHPTCPRCFYNVTGLESNVCPECGADLSIVGVLQPNRVKPLGRLRSAIAVSCIIVAAAVISTPIIVRSIPRAWLINGQVMLSSPRSKAYSDVTIRCAHTFRAAHDAKAPLLAIELRRDKKTSVMIANFNSMSCKFDDGSGRPVNVPLQFDGHEPEATLAQWFQACGIEVDDWVRAEIEEVAAVLRNHHSLTAPLQPGIMRGDQVFTGIPGMAGSLSSFISGNSGAFSGRADNATTGPAPDPWPLRLIVLGWLGVWAIAMWLIVTLVGRRLRRAGCAPMILPAPVFEGSSQP